jgi:DNA-binding NarL/FixJ family response regulator
MRVLIADDHQMFRQGLRLLLESQPDIDIVAEASDGRSAAQQNGRNQGYAAQRFPHLASPNSSPVGDF